jgi:hypothetical protein
MCRWDRVSVRRAPLDGALAGIVPGEAEVGNHRISLVSGMRESRGLSAHSGVVLPHRVSAGT